MFLKQLIIDSDKGIIREINFHKGVNLIIDETSTHNKKESGNNVGKSTVIRLIDYCLAGKDHSISHDTEFKKKHNQQIRNFLEENRVLVTLTLTEDLEDSNAKTIQIQRNFLSRKDKILSINGENLSIENFTNQLKQKIFSFDEKKPTFRQIISKNIRHEKERQLNTLKVLHSSSTKTEYEALFLFWLGISSELSSRKQKLTLLIKQEEKFQARLKEDNSPSKIEQMLTILDKEIQMIEQQKEKFIENNHYKDDLERINKLTASINVLSMRISRLELRKQLIEESQQNLKNEEVSVDTEKIRMLYREAEKLIPNLQKSYEETLHFHNKMIKQREAYIIKELPDIINQLEQSREAFIHTIEEKKQLTQKLKDRGAHYDFEKMVQELNKNHEIKGSLEEQKKSWEKTTSKMTTYQQELQTINNEIEGKDILIQERVTRFNQFFSEISDELYGEKFILTAEKREKCYELETSPMTRNPGTGKKKIEIAAFDLAYIQFADDLGIKCLHFILHDQIEAIHNNQIDLLFHKIVQKINCQYITPVLKDKLPEDFDIEYYKILSLSQNDKLFRI